MAPLLLLLPLLAALAPGPLRAQEGALTGTVRDSAELSPLASVQVEVLGTAGTRVAETLTGPGGRFRIDGLAPGGYTVRFDLPGWRPETRPDVRIEAGAATTLQVTMSQLAFTLNPLTVSASRGQQKLLDAPAAISVVNREEVESNPALSDMDFVKGLAGVDVIQTGLQQGYVVARGFNDIFSGSMLMLTDHRIARVPSLRANISHLNPITNEDIERIEVVLGPGSALYGPNAANGVMHVITRSPIDDPGSSFSVSGGLREQDDVRAFPSSEEGVFHGVGRVAHRFSEKLGFKVSGEYFTGEDWRFEDPDEQENAQLAGACLGAFSLQNPACLVFAPSADELPDAERLGRIADRDFQLERWKVDTRLDWRPTPSTEAIFSYGRTQAVNSVDLTGIGAAQVKDWAAQYAQTRFSWNDLFVQGFMNWTNSGDTFILRTGQPIDDESFIGVGQVQHASRLGARQRFVYGVDYIHTGPVTNESVNGIHEDDDDIDEVGFYLQSETRLSDRWDLILAGRGDYHSVLDELILSPRVGVTFKPAEEHTLRATFNRSFATPDNNNFFLDILAQRIPLGTSGFSYGLRAQGTSDRGFTFPEIGGRPAMKSPFTPASLGGASQFLPTNTATLWALAVGVVSAQDPEAGALLSSLPTPTEEQVAVLLRQLNTGTGQFELVQGGFAGISELPALEEEITNTFEVGYKGLLLGGRLLISADVYYTLVEDFIGPLQVETPNVFLDGQDIAAFLGGFGVDPQTAGALAGQIAAVPLGVITPQEVAGEGANLLLTYRNFDDVDLWGGDLSVDFQLTDVWTLSATTSVVSDDVFTSDDGEIVELNASDFKTGLAVAYGNERLGLDAKLAWRFVNGFPAASGVFIGTVEDYDTFDLTLGYELPGYRNLSLVIDVQNLLDENYSTFPGTPELGRFGMARLRWAP